MERLVRTRRFVQQRLAVVLLTMLCLIGVGQIAAGVLIPFKAVAAQVLLERAFARGVAQHRPVRPWVWADAAPVARISVPRLGVERIVLDTGSGQAMAFGPTLLPGSAEIGEPGVSVLAAHRDTHFRFLRDVQLGDAIDVEGLDGVRRRYRVTGVSIVRWNRFAVPAQGVESTLALATCYPFGAIGHGPLRYVVRARASMDQRTSHSEVGSLDPTPIDRRTNQSSSARDTVHAPHVAGSAALAG
jgi:sortase A